MINRLRAGVAKLAALGAVKRRGVGALQAYGGSIAGEGHVINHKTGEKTKFTMSGQPGARGPKERTT